METTFEIPGSVIKDIINMAVDVGGDLGQHQMLIEKIRDKYCLTYIIPNLWQYEYDGIEMPQD